MSDRRVTNTGKDSGGDITRLCNPSQGWARSKEDAIRDIENSIHTYYVFDGTTRTEIRVVRGRTGKYLRTDPDRTSKNNLDELPDC